MKRRGLSTIVGAVFFVLVMGSTIGYVTYSLDLIDNLAYQVDVKQDENLNRQSEQFKISTFRIDNNEFNLTVTNTGTIPINITNMWTKNMTDSTWNQTRNTINQVISPGQSIANIGQGTGLVALDSQSYLVKLSTSRGNSLGVQFVAATSQPIKMALFATPSSPIAQTNQTILLSVTNNLTNGQILQSVVPVIEDPPDVTGGASATYKLGPDPPSVSSLAPGEIAFFKWTYYIDGVDGNTVIYNATIANAVQGNFVQDTVQIAVPPVSDAVVNEILGGAVGIIQMDFDTFEFCEPSASDCKNSTSNWVRAWEGDTSTKYIWRVNVTNSGLKDIFLDENTAILSLKGKSGGGGNINNAFFIKNPSTQTQEDGGAYNPNNSIVLPVNGTVVVYFGADGEGATALEATNNEAGIYAANMLFFGHEDTNGDSSCCTGDDPYSQNLPFQALLLQ